MSTCSSCQSPIVWATTTAGKPMPLDPTPVPNGNVKLVQGGAPQGGLLAEVLGKAAAAEYPGTLYRSHFVSCPDAGQHRRRK